MVLCWMHLDFWYRNPDDKNTLTFWGNLCQQTYPLSTWFSPVSSCLSPLISSKIQHIFPFTIWSIMPRIKFSHQDSTITIETIIEKNDKVFVSVKDTESVFQKTVWKIWERFTKTDLSRGKDKRGNHLDFHCKRNHSGHEKISTVSAQRALQSFHFHSADCR